MEVKLLNQTNDFLAFYKPSGLPTTYKNQLDNGDCAIKQISNLFPEILNINGYKPKEGGLLYRLDNDTDGLLLIARNQLYFDKIRNYMSKNKLAKKYYAYVDGFLTDHKLSHELVKYSEIYTLEEYSYLVNNQEYLVVRYPIGHSKKSHKRMITVVHDSDKRKVRNIQNAKTYISYIKDKSCCDCLIINGVRHQIRVHLSSIGLPIIGDNLYNKYKALKLKLTCYSIGLIE